MSEQNIKRRGWVKNAAIIFLSVMLALTLFSNTIMNRSLPEVATQYITSGTITARIRGSGTVTANESYEVKIAQSRVVQSVGVKTGSAVEAGDVMFVLSEKDSAELDAAKKNLDDLNNQLERALINAGNTDYARENLNIRRAQEDLQAAKDKRDKNYVAEADMTAARNALTAAQNEVAALEKLVRDIELEITDKGETDALKQQLEDAEGRLAAANSVLTEAEQKLAQLEAMRKEWETGNETIKQLERSLEDLIIGLAELQRQNGVSSALENLDLKSLRTQITAAENEVRRLQNEAVGTELKAPVSGVVKSVYITPGNTTEMNQILAVIEVTDRGYSLSFPVSVEKSKRVRVGDAADTSGWYYWGPPITATLSGIKNDPDNPSQSRLLVFDIKGEIETGTSLSLSIGERSQDYEYIVPNSAVREDANGKFVLIVVAKNTAFTNRYIATRIDVNVLASDDTNSAVSGGISSWDYVITSSTKPIEPGMQVRLVDG